MAGIAFAIAFGIGHVANLSAEGPLMLIAGPLSLAMDLAYRFKIGERRWFSPTGGGALFFIPVWCFGVLWLILGAVYVVQGRT